MMDTISTEELAEKIENQEEFVLVDVLSEDHFAEGHLPGAINIPLDTIAEEATEQLDRDQEIVVYCASESCQASPKAAKKLEAMGFKNVRDYEPGLKGWKESGHKVEA